MPSQASLALMTPLLEPGTAIYSPHNQNSW